MRDKIIKNKKVISMLIGLLILLVAIFVVFNIIMANRDLNTKKINNEDVYIYFGNEKFDFKGNITITKDENITNIKLNNKKTELYSEPIYYKNKDRVILPVFYSYVEPGVGKQNKVNYYTEVIKKNNSYYLVGNNLNYKVNGGFLYDGSDYYVFLDSLSINFNNKKINVSPLSFVNYVFNTKELYIYDYGNSKIYYYDNVNSDVIASNSKYKINLSSDLIIINGKDKLLMKNFDYLKRLK